MTLFRTSLPCRPCWSWPRRVWPWPLASGSAGFRLTGLSAEHGKLDSPVLILTLPPTLPVNLGWSFPSVWPSSFMTVKWAHNSSCLPGSGRMNKMRVFFPETPPSPPRELRFLRDRGAVPGLFWAPPSFPVPPTCPSSSAGPPPPAPHSPRSLPPLKGGSVGGSFHQRVSSSHPTPPQSDGKPMRLGF